MPYQLRPDAWCPGALRPNARCPGILRPNTHHCGSCVRTPHTIVSCVCVSEVASSTSRPSGAFRRSGHNFIFPDADPAIISEAEHYSVSTSGEGSVGQNEVLRQEIS